MAEIERKDDYSKGFLGDLFDAGAQKELRPKVDDLHDLNEMVIDAEEKVLAGAHVADDEVEAYITERRAGNQSDYEDNVGSVNTLSTTNTVINVVSCIPLATKLGGKAVGKVSSAVAKATGHGNELVAAGARETASSLGKLGTDYIRSGHVLKGVGCYAKAGVKVVGAAGDKVDDFFKGKGEAMSKAANGATKTVKRVTMTGVEYSDKLTKMGKAMKVGGFALKNIGGNASVIAPIAVAQMYTRGRTEEMSQELTDAMTVALDRYDFVVENGDKIAGDAGEAYGEWGARYAAASDDLQGQLDRGEITQAQFDEQCEAMQLKQAEELKELDSRYPEAAKQMVTEGEAYRTAETAATLGTDVDDIAKYDSHTGNLMTEYPDAKDKYEDYREQYQSTAASGSSFGSWLASMHAALIHYVPGFAYVEAAVAKGADMVFGFAGEKLPIFDYEERYKGQGLDQMARSICDTAEARYEEKQRTDAQQQILADAQQGYQQTMDGTELSMA